MGLTDARFTDWNYDEYKSEYARLRRQKRAAFLVIGAKEHVVVHGKQQQLDWFNVPFPCTRPRRSENDALDRCKHQLKTRKSKIPKRLYDKVSRLENIAMYPELYPWHVEKPSKALAGVALWGWIAKRVGVQAWEVREWLDDMEDIETINFRAGIAA